MSRGPEKLGRFLGATIVIALCLLLSSCSTYRLSTLNHDPLYGSEVVYLEVPEGTKIDTINSFSKLRYKLRTDFSFRWDFAQYAMNQPYSFYWSNPMLEGIWRPYNRFDVYFHSYHFWTDWAFGYPYNNWNSFYSWNRPWGHYGWNRPYNPWNNWYNGPWHNPGYNVVWNSSRRNNIAYINGPRGSRNNIIANNNNIENTIVRRYNKPRNNVNVIDNVVNELRENFNKPIRVYNNPNNVSNNNIIVKPNNNNNNINNNNIRGSWRPNNNSNSSSNIYTRPPVNNSNTSTRSSSNVSRSSSVSRGGNSNRKN
jgi:hypothetical protein